MIRYLLDTNAVVALLRDKDSSAARRLRQHCPAEVGISSIVSHELHFGAFKSRWITHNVALIDGLRFETVDFDKEDSRHAGEIRAALSLRGMLIGPYDVLIAGQAKARDLILVTHNTAEFGRVSELRIVDWET